MERYTIKGISLSVSFPSSLPPLQSLPFPPSLLSRAFFLLLEENKSNCSKRHRMLQEREVVKAVDKMNQAFRTVLVQLLGFLLLSVEHRRNFSPAFVWTKEWFQSRAAMQWLNIQEASHCTSWNKASIQPDSFSWGNESYEHTGLVALSEVMESPEQMNCFPWKLEALGPRMAILLLRQLPCCPASLCDLIINDHQRRHLKMS